MRILAASILVGLFVQPAAAAVVTFGMSGDDWAIDVPRATHTRVSRHEHRFATRTWSLQVRTWPMSRVFIQHLDDELASMRGRDPDLIVLHEEARGDADWSVVVAMNSAVHGVVLRPGGGDNAMCTFTVPRRASWRQPLAACRSLRTR